MSVGAPSGVSQPTGTGSDPTKWQQMSAPDELVTEEAPPIELDEDGDWAVGDPEPTARNANATITSRIVAMKTREAALCWRRSLSRFGCAFSLWSLGLGFASSRPRQIGFVACVTMRLALDDNHGGYVTGRRTVLKLSPC